MKKVFVVFMLVSTLLVATGCQQASVTPESTQQSSLKQEQGTATIVIQNQEAVTSKEVTFRENESLLEVMKENFAIKEKRWLYHLYRRHQSRSKSQSILGLYRQ